MLRTLTRDEARDRAALLDVTSYTVELDLTGLAGGSAFTSTCEVRFACREPGASTFLELDGELLALQRGGHDVQATVQGNRVLLADLAAEEVVRVTARCAATRTGEGLHRSVDPADGEVYVYMQAFLDDAQRVFACFDQPDLKASVQLTVTAPVGWRVLANTRAEQIDGRHVFAPTERISTYLVTLAAGPWHGRQRLYEPDGIELGVWCRQSLAAHLEADELLDITAACLDVQQDVFGSRYPFGDSYDQVFVPEFNAGAMENPGMVTLSDELFVFRSRTTQGRRRLRAQVIAHEMAHMWFGDLVTMRWWDDLWLNEAFAEMLGTWTVERAHALGALPHGGGWADFCLGRKAWGYRADQLPTTHPVAGDVPDNRAALLNFDGISYAKGASALRQLAAWLGEDVFFAGVRGYLQEHAWGNTGLADLLSSLERASGRDLQDWAQRWLRTPGVPVLRVADGQVHQQAPVLRPHRLGVAAYGAGGTAAYGAGGTAAYGAGGTAAYGAGGTAAYGAGGTAAYGAGGTGLHLVERVELELTGASAPLVLAPGELVLPNDGDLTFAKVRLDPVSLATALTRTGELADPLARAVVWGALYDTARDGELPAADLVGAVLAGVAAEADPEVVATLLGQARHAATHWSPDGAPLLARLHAHCCREVSRLEPGSDLQVAYARAAVETAVGDVEAELLRTWLDEEDLPAGLVVDQDLRWHLLLRLSALGHPDVRASRLQVELGADRTTSGEQQAARALAARPDPAAKAAAWAELFGAAELSNGRARALAAGFWQSGQDDLLRPYAGRWTAGVQGLFTRRGPQLATFLARSLFPSTLVEPATLAATRLAGDLAPGLRRVLLEERDELERALRARSA